MERIEQERMGTVPQYTHTERRQGRMGMWFSAFAFGAMIGGTLGLLFAPRRGSEIRRQLAQNLGARGVTPEFRERVSRTLAAGRISPTEMVSQTQRELEDLRSQGLSRLNDARLRARIMQKQAELRYLQSVHKLRREV